MRELAAHHSFNNTANNTHDVLLLLLPSHCSWRSSFYVGQVQATGRLRVSSTAPYFVDDRLYCREEDMQESKPLHLCVSLVPEEALSTVGPQAGAGLSANLGVSGGPRRTPRGARVKLDASEEEAVSREGTHENCDVTEAGGSANGGSAVQDSASTREGAPAAQQADAATGDGVQSTPWVLDICLVRIAGGYGGLFTFDRVHAMLSPV